VVTDAVILITKSNLFLFIGKNYSILTSQEAF